MKRYIFGKKEIITRTPTHSSSTRPFT